MAKKTRGRIVPKEVRRLEDNSIGIFCDALEFFADFEQGSFRPFAADYVVGELKDELDTEEIERLWAKVDISKAKTMLAF